MVCNNETNEIFKLKKRLTPTELPIVILEKITTLHNP